MAPSRPDSLWTKTFLLLCAAQFLGYAQNAMLAPILPLYVTQLGGSPFIVGLVLACFAASSVIVRPLVGHWADRWSEAGVMITGLLFQGTTIVLCLVPWVGTTMLANGLRGVGWGGLNTGGYSLLAHIAPESRRGEASDVSFGGFAVAFLATTVFSWIGAALGASIPHHATVRDRAGQRLALGSHWWHAIFHFIEIDILLPSVMLLWLNLSLPSITNFSVLYARQLGISDFGIFFIIVGTTSLLARPLLGRLSDRIGRDLSIATGFGLQILGLLVMTTVSSLAGMIGCGMLYMLGNAIGSSTTLALALERADPLRRGKQMATFSIAYPLSYGVGSVITGSTIEFAGYTGMFLAMAGLQALGLIFALVQAQNLRSYTA
jgi:MFS family permease